MLAGYKLISFLSAPQVNALIAAHHGTIVSKNILIRRVHKPMTQTTNRFFDELAKMMTDASGAAQGVRGEIDTLIRGQAERVLRDLDIVQREEFDAMKAMAVKAREENSQLEKRIAELEGELASLGGKGPTSSDGSSQE